MKKNREVRKASKQLARHLKDEAHTKRMGHIVAYRDKIASSLGKEQVTPHNMTRREARQFARGLYREVAQEIMTSPEGRLDNEHVGNFAMRKKLKRACRELKEAGFVFESENEKQNATDALNIGEKRPI